MPYNNRFLSLAPSARTCLLAVTLLARPLIAAPPAASDHNSMPSAVQLVEPADFYVDAIHGDDRNDGRVGRPFRTIQKAVDAMKSPGSVCTIRAGVYRETVRFHQSGTAAKPLCFQAEPGAVLSGAEPIEAWKSSETDSGPDSPRATDLYYAVVGQNSLRKGGKIAIFIGGRIAPEARWPNDGGSYPWPTYAYCSDAGYNKDGKNGWIADADLPDRPDDYWKGCRLIVLAGHGWTGRDLPILR